MIKKYKQFNEGINHLLVGPTDEEMRENFFKNDYNLFTTIELYDKGIITIDDVVKKLMNNSQFIISFLRNANLLDKIPFEKLLEYGINSNDLVLYCLSPNTTNFKNKDIPTSKLNGLIIALENGGDLKRVPRYIITNLLEGNNEKLIKLILNYFIDNKVPYNLLTMNANLNIMNNHPNLIEIREKYINMLNEFDNKNNYSEFFPKLPPTAEDFMQEIINNLKHEINSSYDIYYFNNKVLFIKHGSMVDFIYMRKIITEVLQVYYKLDNSDSFYYIKKYIIDIEPINLQPLNWNEKYFESFDKK